MYNKDRPNRWGLELSTPIIFLPCCDIYLILFNIREDKYINKFSKISYNIGSLGSILDKEDIFASFKARIVKSLWSLISIFYSF
jgi:hypothetical protein